MIITLISEPMLGPYGPSTPIILLAREFARRGYEVYVVSSTVRDDVRRRVEDHAHVVDLGFKSRLLNEASTSYVEYWFWEALLGSLSKKFEEMQAKGLIPRSDYVINTSNTIAINAEAWYAQGPVFEAMENVSRYSPLKYRVPYTISKYLIRGLDSKLMKKLRRVSKLAISNSYTMKNIYESLGIKIDGVIYEPIDTNMFRPKPHRPSEDYVLTYFGKETDYKAVKKVADAGVKIKAFGSKASSFIPKEVMKHPNIEVLGFVADEVLVDIYSNALFTMFPFTEEPFGYVPVESMACGTPVLTYNRQGPKETVINGVTGWLANSDEELVKLAVKLWREGYPSWMRSKSRDRALEFDIKAIADKWIETIKELT